MGKVRLTPAIHPLLFGAFPVLFLYAQNADEMALADVRQPLIIVLGVAIGLTVLFSLAMRNFTKGGLMASFTVFLSLSFGHFVGVLPEFEITLAESIIGPSLLMLIFSGVLLYRLWWAISRTRRDLSTLTRYLSWIGAALVLLEVAHGGAVLATGGDTSEGEELSIAASEDIQRTPDIYYLVFDGYARSDILKEVYDFDNSGFIEELRNMGFHVADSSYANYPQTLPSLGSSLNMDFAENLGTFDRSSKRRPELAKKLHNNAVFDFLGKLGYTTVVFASGYNWTELDGDRVITPGWSTNEFQSMLFSISPLPVFLDSKHSPFAAHHRRVSYAIDKLPHLSHIRSPKFVFAHIVSPHPPFVFDADGDFVQYRDHWSFSDGSHLVKDSSGAEQYKRRYREQIAYITEEIRETLRELLENAGEEPPIIILQADHGPGSGLSWSSWIRTNLRERFGILNAYYLPGIEGDPIYDEITPVNSFRVVFNHYFGTDLDLLPDKHEFVTWPKPSAFHAISKRLGGSAYSHLMDTYSSMPPDTVSMQDVSEFLENCTPYHDNRYRTFTERGLVILSDTTMNAGKLEISIDYRDEYEIQYRYDSTRIASDTVSAERLRSGGLRVVALTVPAEARRRGYNNIFVRPVNGDGAYAMGHLRPLR